MEMEVEKNKLHSEIERLQKEHNELTSTLSDLRKCILVDKGDYKLIEAERIAKIEGLDEKLIDVKVELEEKQNSVKNLVNSSNSLQQIIEILKKGAEKEGEKKKDLQTEIDSLVISLNQIKIAFQNEETEKRDLIRSLNAEIDEKKEELRVMREEYEAKRFEILKDERLLSIKRSDLEIYEMRMKKKYPSETFVLKDNATSTKIKD